MNMSTIGLHSAITVNPANCPALVKLVREIRVASNGFRPKETAMVPKPKLTEK